jgi:calcineurin-like phosphoesterase family protein
MSSLRWLHLSDFHFGKEVFQQELVSGKIIDHIKEQISEGNKPDFIFITGDIANAGKKEEYELFVKIILDPIIETMGRDFKDRIFVVPGNHDLNRKTNKGFSRESFLGVEGGFFDPTAESLDDRNMLIDRFTHFMYQIELPLAIDIFSESGSYNAALNVNGVSVGVVGLNTAWLCHDEKDKYNLTPGVALARSALESISHCSIKIVLGHHPLEWIHANHIKPLKALFGLHNVIYLHGHMHVSWAEPNYGAGNEFLTIQTGAGYQAPEGSKWKNGLLWGHLDTAGDYVALQPYQWSRDDQCWELTTGGFQEVNREADWWHFELPKKHKKNLRQNQNKIKLPGGWEVTDFETLVQNLVELDEAEAVRFFDGATPEWRVALSKSIPRREIVNQLKSTYFSLSSSSETTVCTLLAAGCEGKSTALLQACFEIVNEKKSKKILFRRNNIRPFDADTLLPTLRLHDDWLIVIDEADQVARQVLTFIESGFLGLSSKVDFLLASRDSDWKTSGANTLSWSFTSAYKEVTLKDLSQPDAEMIVTAWSSFGEKGLGTELTSLEHDTRVEKLKFYAKTESKGGSGAFFGALLLSRHSGDLFDHAESMLDRLDQISINGSKTLRDALAYIAAMHTEGFDKLSFETLAAVLGLTVPKLQSNVIKKLGQEAAATTTATAIYTRHKYIASAIIKILEDKFDIDISNLFIDLALSELERSKHVKVLNLNFWKFELADSLFASGKTRLAIALVEKLVSSDRHDPFLVTKLASFYRRENDAIGAIKLFREFGYGPKHRAFYFEWAVCEGKEKNYLENALLASYALSDDVESTQLIIDEAIIMLSGLATCYAGLYRQLGDAIFDTTIEAALSISSILVRARPSYRNRASVDAFLKRVARKRAKLYSRVDAIKLIKSASNHLLKYSVDPLVTQAIDVHDSMYNDLNTLIENVENSKPKIS